MNKDDIIQIEITDMAEDGAGIGRSEDGMAVFVHGAVYGDIVNAQITKVKKNYAFSDAIEIVNKSPFRVELSTKSSNENAVCPYIDECGGCAFGKLNYETQLKLKEKHVRDKLERIADLEAPVIREIMGMETAWPTEYRNKAVIAVHQDSSGNAFVGFRGRKSHKVIDCDYCMIQGKPANIATGILREYLTKHRAGIWQMTVKTAFETGEVMVILHVKGRSELPDVEGLCYDLDEAIDSIGYSLESVCLEREYVVKEGGRKAPAKSFTKTKLEFIAGKHTIKDSLMGLDFEISPRAFYQVNPAQTKKLYSKVLEYLGTDCEDGLCPQADDVTSDVETQGSVILDLYCGVGTIGTLVAKNYSGQVLGIESVKEAVIDANRNAVINGIVNERFICGKAEEVLPDLVNRDGLDPAETANLDPTETANLDSVEAVILDPPRAGCDEKLLEAVVSVKPRKIVYVSCNPGTLGRDLKFLGEHGYEFIEATPCDMFCHSSHIETVALMTKVDNRTR